MPRQTIPKTELRRLLFQELINPSISQTEGKRYDKKESRRCGTPGLLPSAAKEMNVCEDVLFGGGWPPPSGHPMKEMII